MLTFVEWLADFFWNPWLLGLFLLTGLVYSLGSGFFQLFDLRLWLRATFGSLLRHPVKTSTGLSSFQALSTALASTMGTSGEVVVALSLFLFAFSSILGWSYYGQQCLRYLVGNDRLLPPYRLIFLICIPVGAIWDPILVWQLVNLFNALMALPNIAALLLLAPQALCLLSQWKRRSEAPPLSSGAPRRPIQDPFSRGSV